MVAIKEESIKLGQELGQGEFGSVLKGVYTGNKGVKMDVAVKTLRIDAMGHGEKVGQLYQSTHVKSASRACVCVVVCRSSCVRQGLW
jgi:hypothetical protein